MWNAKVEALPIVKGEFKIWKPELFTVIVCKVMDSCQFKVYFTFDA